MWIWIAGGTVAFVLGFVWSLLRLPSRDEIPMHTERRQMVASLEQRDRTGAY